MLAHFNRQVLPSDCHHNFNRWQGAVLVVFNGGSHGVLQNRGKTRLSNRSLWAVLHIFHCSREQCLKMKRTLNNSNSM